MNINIKNRLRNKAFILSAISFIVLIIKTFTHYQLPENFDVIINMALSLFTGLGVIIDPSTEGISDKNIANQESQQ